MPLGKKKSVTKVLKAKAHILMTIDKKRIGEKFLLITYLQLIHYQ